MKVGIRGQLLDAFGISAVLMGVISFVAWLSFAHLGAVVSGIAEKNIPTIASAFRLAENVNTVVTGTIGFAAARDENARAAGLIKLKEYDHTLRTAVAAIAKAEGQEKTTQIKDLQEFIFVNIRELDDSLARSIQVAGQYHKRVETVQADHAALRNALVPWIKTAKEQFIGHTKTLFEQEHEIGVLRGKILRSSVLNISFLQSLLEMQMAADLLNGLYGQVGTIRDRAILGILRKNYLSVQDRLLRSYELLPSGPEREALHQALERSLAHGRETDGLFVLHEDALFHLQTQDDLLFNNQGLASDMVGAAQKMVEETRVTITDQIATTLVEVEWNKILLAILATGGVLLVAFLYGDRRLARRMRRLAASTSAIAHGSLDAAIDASGHDEITDIAQTLVVFRDNARAHETLRAEQRDQ